MLEYKINNAKAKIKYYPIEYTDIIQNENGGGSLIIYSACNDKENHSEVLSFYREDGSEILYFEDSLVNDTKIESGKSVYSLDVFENIPLTIESAEKIHVESEGKDYILITFNEPHYFNENRDNVNVSIVLVSGNTYMDTFCPDYYYIQGDYFLYHYLGSGNTVSANTVSTLYWRDSLGVSHNAEAIVPVTQEGKDFRQTVLLEYAGDARDILVGDNKEIWDFWVKDERFFKFTPVEDEENIWTLSQKNGTVIRFRFADINLAVPMEETFYPGLLKDDGLHTYLVEEAEKKITEPLDYEKQQFVPIYKSGDGNEYDLSSIEYITLLKPKDDEWNTIKAPCLIDPSSPSKSYYSNCIEKAGNRMFDMRFEMGDIYYRRKKVSETFLRLSFYNNRDRKTQKLLYSVKIYLNEDLLWKQYINARRTVLHWFNNMPFSFKSTEKYDFSNTTEGFYLYLFPGDIKELDYGTVYLKAELNNAKFGKAVPLSIPKRGNTVEEKKFITYDKEGEYTDMRELLEDMYIEVRIRYNSAKKRYEWWIPDGITIDEKDNTSAQLNLFEPRITNYNASN